MQCRRQGGIAYKPPIFASLQFAIPMTHSRLLIILSSFLIVDSVCFSQPAPVAYYPFTVNGTDSSGNANNGAVVGGTVSGGVLNLGDNANDYFAIPGTTVNGLTDFTISFNLKINTLHITGDAPDNQVFGGSRSGVVDAFNFAYNKNSNSFVFALDVTGYFFSYPDLQQAADYCIVLERASSNLSLFVNGLQVGSTITVPTTAINIQSNGFLWGQEQDCVGGCFAQNQCLAGELDNIKIFDEALLPADVHDLCNTCVTKLNYPFTINASDSSGNAFTGTLMGGAAVQNGLLHIGDNAQDYLSVPESAVNGLTDFEISTAVKFDTLHVSGNSPTNVISTGESNGSLDNFNLTYNKSLSEFQTTIGGNPYNFSYTASTGIWYCIVWMRIGNETKLFVNGTQVGSTLPAIPDAIAINAGAFLIGQEQDCIGGCFEQDQSLAGSVAYFRIINCPDTEALNHECNILSGIISPPVSQAVIVYPNPFSTEIFVDGLEGGGYHFSLYDVLGRKLFESNLNSSGKISLQNSRLAGGVYFYELRKEQEIISAGKLVAK